MKHLNEDFEDLIGGTTDTIIGIGNMMLSSKKSKKKKSTINIEDSDEINAQKRVQQQKRIKQQKLLAHQQQKKKKEQLTHNQQLSKRVINVDIENDFNVNIDEPKQVVSPEIIIPQLLADINAEQIRQQAIKSVEKKKKERVKKEKNIEATKTLKKVGKNKKKVQEKVQQVIIEAEQKGQVVTVQQKQQLAQQLSQTITSEQITPDDYEVVKEVIEEENNVSLDNVDTVKLVEGVGAAIEAIPDAEPIKIEDLEITVAKSKKDKTGYFKTKVNIKKDSIPEDINKIASYIKQHSNGIIKPRVCDLRVIGNTNKTQLRNSELKLSVNTVVFKPDHTKLKVNKGTRFMISIPEDYSATGNLLVYLQESRAKTIMELTAKDFPNKDVFIEFIGDRIAEYYYHGYDVTLKKLQLRSADNVLMPVISNVLNTRDYKAKPMVNKDNHLYGVEFVSNGSDNQWLSVFVEETKELGKYTVYGFNNLTIDKYYPKQKDFTLQWLMDNLVILLNQFYSKDWSNEKKAGDFEEIYYMHYKLTHKKLWDAMTVIRKMSEPSDDEDTNPDDYNPNGIQILETASKKDMKRLQKNDYDAEAIIGKTNYLDSFILTYLAYPIIGGDRRKGRQYITRDQYYDKYSVSDRRNYQQREKTILKKEGIERNYNARIYCFQLEYKIKGNNEPQVYRSKSFKDVMDVTRFLTNNPASNVDSPIK